MTTSSKRIFITGGASGLGRALAMRYARDGWRVAVGDVNEARTAETVTALGANAIGMRVDVTRIADLEAAADRLSREWGGVDVVVNNAGIASGGPLESIPMEEWARVIDINLMGVVRGCKVFAPLLKAQGSGHIVNIASMAGLMNLPMMSSYNTTKAAVIALSETLRMELADGGVRVTVVCPSFFRTNLAESMHAGAPADTRELVERWVSKNKIDADTIASKVFDAVARNDLHVLTHNETKVAWAVKRLLPFGVFHHFVKKGAERIDAAQRARKGSGAATA